MLSKQEKVYAKFEDLINVLNSGIYEKGSEIALSLLAMIAGESIILLGPPGVAKSMVARQMKKAIKGGTSFEYLMSRFSTPDEIFGPVSISKLKTEDKYERITKGYLPSADVAFLDEIWKAGPAIQNTLLTILNEKIFHNGDTDEKVPLKLLIAASNELPARDEGLEALWDRFLIRFMSKNIQSEDLFYQMLLDDETDVPVPASVQITAKEYREWQEMITEIKVPEEILHCITDIRKHLKAAKVMDNVTRDIYVSDRRWKHILRLMKAAALLNGRDHVDYGDLSLLRHCLWNEPEEQEEITRIISSSIFHEANEKVKLIDGFLKRDIKDHELLKAVQQGGGMDDEDREVRIHNNFYYLIPNHGTGRTYILIPDYKRIKTYESYYATYGARTATPGVMYQDQENPKRTIIQTYATFGAESKLAELKYEEVKLLRRRNKIYINGVEFALDLLEPGEVQNIGNDLSHPAHYNYSDEYARLLDDVLGRSTSIGEGLFTDEDVASQVVKHKNDLIHGIDKSMKLIEKLYQ